MADRRLLQLADGDLETALRGLTPAVAWPAPTLPDGSDIAAAVRARVEALPVRDRQGAAGLAAPFGWSWRPARRALVLALVALLALVAIAAALGLGLPGLRINLGAAPPLPSSFAVPSLTPGAALSAGPSVTSKGLGALLRLGDSLDPADRASLDERAGFAVLLPTDPAIGNPETAYVDETKGGQVTLLWPTAPGLPSTLEPEIGLLISEFRGTVREEFFMKATSADTIIEPVQVGEHDGYWLTGDPHVFFWESQGGFVDDARRWVGDVLLWSDGAITYRLETSLGRDRAIELAAGMR